MRELEWEGDKEIRGKKESRVGKRKGKRKIWSKKREGEKGREELSRRVHVTSKRENKVNKKNYVFYEAASKN